MRLEVRLAPEVLHAVNPHVVTDERHRHDKRHEFAPVLVDASGEFHFRSRVEQGLEVAGHVHQYIRVPARRRGNRP